MARKARKRCESRIYHVVLRGINRQDIFFDDEDYQRLLETVAQKNRISSLNVPRHIKIGTNEKLKAVK